MDLSGIIKAAADARAHDAARLVWNAVRIHVDVMDITAAVESEPGEHNAALLHSTAGFAWVQDLGYAIAGIRSRFGCAVVDTMLCHALRCDASMSPSVLATDGTGKSKRHWTLSIALDPSVYARIAPCEAMDALWREHMAGSEGSR